MFKELRIAVLLLVLMSVLTGVIYPLVVTAVAQFVFPYQSGGSIVVVDQHPVGSELIGQSFTAPQYFWGRPSATSPLPYNAAASGGSNFGPLNPLLVEVASTRIAALREYATPSGAIPVDLVTSSASGLDPHISPAAAEFQIPRIAKFRQITEDKVRDLVALHTQARQWGVLGEARVNVLSLNLALDRVSQE